MKNMLMVLSVVLSAQLLQASAPTDLKVWSIKDTQASFAFKDNSDGDKFRFYFNGKTDTTIKGDISDREKNNGQYVGLTFRNLKEGTNYSIEIAVIDENGDEMFRSSPLSFKTLGESSTTDTKNTKITKEELRNKILNAEDLRNIDVSGITDMSYLLSGINFSKVDSEYHYIYSDEQLEAINNWDVSNVTNMEGMFQGTTFRFPNSFGKWDVSNVTNMSKMFLNTSRAQFFGKNSAEVGGIGLWNVSNVTNMSYMFSGTFESFINLSSWDVSNVTNMEGMFSYLDDATFQDIGSWDVSNVTNMHEMFAMLYESEIDNLSSWDVSNVKDHVDMFKPTNTYEVEPSAIPLDERPHFPEEDQSVAPSDIKIWNINLSKGEASLAFKDNSDGDKFRFYFNGKTNNSIKGDIRDREKNNGQYVGVNLSNLPGGEYNVEIAVIDKNGVEIARSEPTQFIVE